MNTGNPERSVFAATCGVAETLLLAILPEMNMGIVPLLPEHSYNGSACVNKQYSLSWQYLPIYTKTILTGYLIELYPVSVTVSFINSLMQLYPECDVNMSGWKINGPLAKYDIETH